jgi:hypothetical protein
MHKFFFVVIAVLFVQLVTRSGLASTLVRRETEASHIELLFAESSNGKGMHALRYWGVSDRKTLVFPALLRIEYRIGTRRYEVPQSLVSGIGGVNTASLTATSAQSLIVRDDDRWIVITLYGGDGSNAFIAEWRIERSTGCVIRFVRDLEAPGRLGTRFGPEVLFGEAVEVK